MDISTSAGRDDAHGVSIEAGRGISMDVSTSAGSENGNLDEARVRWRGVRSQDCKIVIWRYTRRVGLHSIVVRNIGSATDRHRPAGVKLEVLAA